MADKEFEAMHKAIEEKLMEKRLSKDEKEKLFLSIRYSYLRHEELVDTGFNPNFEGAKAYIMQGLSFRLDPYEKSNVNKFTINLKPRANYGVDMERKLAESYAKSRQDMHNQ